MKEHTNKSKKDDLLQGTICYIDFKNDWALQSGLGRRVNRNRKNTQWDHLCNIAKDWIEKD